MTLNEHLRCCFERARKLELDYADGVFPREALDNELQFMNAGFCEEMKSSIVAVRNVMRHVDLTNYGEGTTVQKAWRYLRNRMDAAIAEGELLCVHPYIWVPPDEAKAGRWFLVSLLYITTRINKKEVPETPRAT